MPSSLNQDIRRHLDHYIEGETILEVFSDWFVPATWDVDKSGDQPTVDLTYEIILRLAEFSNGDCTEEQLKQILGTLVALSPAGVSSF